MHLKNIKKVRSEDINQDSRMKNIKNTVFYWNSNHQAVFTGILQIRNQSFFQKKRKYCKRNKIIC